MSEEKTAASSDEGPFTFVFDAELDITGVLPVHEKLNELLNHQKQFVLNAENVTKIDGAGLQLIAAFVLAANKLNLQVSWTGVSEIFEKNAQILGLTEILAFKS